MHRGYIKLWRKSQDSGLLQNPYAWTLWCHLLMKATHKPHKQLVGNQVVELEPGQVIIGRKALADQLGMTEKRSGLA